MAQLWLTYQEIGDELGCTPDDARDAAVQHGWARKHSSDGLTRVLMPAPLMHRYFASAAKRFGALDTQVAVMVGDLRSALADMSTIEPAGLRRAS